MDSDKFPSDEGFEDNTDFGSDGSSRARNRTVMLTPEVTGEVRARLAKDLEAGARSSQSTPRSTFSPGGMQPAPQQPTPQVRVEAPDPYKAPTPPVAQQSFIATGMFWARPSRIRGFLVAYDREANGEVFDLRVGRLIVTSEAAGSGSYLVLDDDTVSPMHAILKISDQGDVIQVLDQLSENGTTIVSYATGDVFELSGDKGEVGHGDTIAFGERRFQVCLIPQLEE
jgi:hypothetical protein